MLKTIMNRLGQGVLVLFVLETITFVLIRLLPGHPFMGEKKLPDHILHQLQSNYGLNESFWVQYAHYWQNILTKGDFGPSLIREGVSVSEIISQAFPVSLLLGVFSMIIAVMIGIPSGIVAAFYKNRWIDWSVMFIALVGICVPAFVLAPVLGIALGMNIPFLSVAGWDDWYCVILPGLTLGILNAAYLARLTRSGMLDVLNQDFIRTAKAKGVSSYRLIVRHALRGGLTPALSFLGPAFAAVITGSFVVETCFQVPGMGMHFVNATTDRDYFLIQGLVLFYGLMIVVANLFVDVLLYMINPQLRKAS